MITGRQRAGLRIERRNQAASIISNTIQIVNQFADYQTRQHKGITASLHRDA